jgi:RHS repeat-associated protein
MMVTVTCGCDSCGRRIEKVSPTATSIFVYDGDNLVETVNASGGEVASYAQGQNLDEPLAMDRSGTIDYYEQDGLGALTSLTASNGSVAQSYTYDSFGNTTNSTDSLTNFFRYTAREFDTETNLYYYRVRYYDQTSGRFVSEDPLRFSANRDNFYEYTFNNAVDLAGPSGEQPIPLPVPVPEAPIPVPWGFPLPDEVPSVHAPPLPNYWPAPPLPSGVPSLPPPAPPPWWDNPNADTSANPSSEPCDNDDNCTERYNRDINYCNQKFRGTSLFGSCLDRAF